MKKQEKQEKIKTRIVPRTKKEKTAIPPGAFGDNIGISAVKREGETDEDIKEAYMGNIFIKLPKKEVIPEKTAKEWMEHHNQTRDSLKASIGMLEKQLMKYNNSGFDVLAPYMKRYKRIHVWAKNKLFKNGLRIMKKVLKNYTIEDIDKIPNEWYNAHHRMFYHCWHKALDSVFTKMIYPMGKCDAKKFKSPDDYLQHIKLSGYWSYQNRSDIIKIWMCEIMEDTVDREWVNFFMMENYWAMHRFYNGNVPKPNGKDFPVYKSMTQMNPEYFINGRHRPKWSPQESEE